MSNSDLAALLDEVRFSTPERAFDDQDSTEALSMKSDTTKTGTERKSVILSDRSLTRPPELFENFDQRDNETIPSSTYGVITDGSKDFPGKGGTSPLISSEDKKKCRLLCIENPNEYCRAVMGQGSSFCVNKNCLTRHKNPEKVNVCENNLHVLKSSEKSRATAFLDPALKMTGIDQEIIDTWAIELKTLKQWSKTFRLAKFAKETQGVATKQAYLEEKTFEKQAKVYKTPKKEKVKEMIDTSLPEVYSSFTPETGSFASEDDARNFMLHIETTFKSLNREIFKLNKNQVVMHELLDNGIRNLDARVTDLEDEVGEKPVHLERKYDAPNLWGSISAVASIFGNEKTDINDESFRSLLNATCLKLERKNEFEADEIRTNVKTVKDTLINVTRTFKDQISMNARNINYLEKSTTSRSTNLLSDHTVEELSGDFKELKMQVDNLDDRVKNMDSQGDVIQFHSLNFTSKSEADAWLEHHAPNGNFGLVVDFHTLMEHIHHSITGVDALKQLQNVYKLKMKTLSEALSVASFEVPVPRYFTNSGTHVVIDNQES